MRVWEDVVACMRNRRRMYVLDDRFLTTCAFLTGFGSGRGDGVERAFTAWLASRQAHYKNFSFPPMVLAEAGLRRLGATEDAPLTDVEHRQAIETLCDLLSEFFDVVKPI